MTEPDYYIFASDPHGTGQPWINLVKKAHQAYPNSKIVFGGDYIDGNPYSNETVQFVMDQVQHHHAEALKGNHEQMLQDFVKNNDDLWYYNGAKTTIKSFYQRGFSKHVAKVALRSGERYKFLSKLPFVYETKHLIFVHAGIACWEKNWKNPAIYQDLNPVFRPYSLKDREFFELWSREKYWYGTNEDYFFAHNRTGKTIVTGHTPTMLLFGEYDNQQTGFKSTYDWRNDPNKDPKLLRRPCPVRTVQYNNEMPRYFTDDGCHSASQHHGNICIFTNTGKLVKIFNNDPKEEVFSEN